MPRHKRLNIPGAVYHVISRGLERRKIFIDDLDYKEFLYRLEITLKETKCLCYAWTLMPNHFHLLIRTGEKTLTDLMRKILTGYAVYFNRRYRRHGYLYQNRYKSILCQEDAYLLEIVRYIHLNPIRGRILVSVEELDRYPWSGHSVLAGRHRRDWQSTDEVLSSFSRGRKTAILKYRGFVKDGLKMGKRSDLTGGGLKRSAGGWDGIMELRRNKELWRGDERILGDSNFVTAVLKASEETLKKRTELKLKGWTLEKLIKKVCNLYSIEPDDLKKKGRKNNISNAKILISYYGNKFLGFSGAGLSELFQISKQAVAKTIEKGEKYVRENNIKLLS